jgi:hypothetical protein
MEETIVKEEPVIEVPEEPKEPKEEPVAPGAKTEPELLLESLHKEREKRRELERQLKERGEMSVLSDEGRILQNQIEELKRQQKVKEEETTLSRLISSFPALKDKASDFDEYRNLPENDGVNVETLAKAFLVDRNLIGSPAPRKGLEEPAGGGRVPPKQGRTEQEVSELRSGNYRQYLKELRAGTLWK